MELLKCVLLDIQLLQVRNADPDFLCWPHIPDLHVHDVLAVWVNLCVNCLLAFLDGLLILIFGLLFFLDDSFNPFIAELSNEFVNASIGVDGKAELDLKEFVGGVDVLLLESDACKSIGDFDVVIDVLERHGDMIVRFDV